MVENDHAGGVQPASPGVVDARIAIIGAGEFESSAALRTTS